MAIITLTTDLGYKDSYLASVKATILNEIEDINIIDISNSIEPFNIQQAAFVLKNCISDFPNGTVHIIGVDDELSLENEHLAVYANNQFFLAADNGIFSLLFDTIQPDMIVELNLSQKSDSLTFATKNVLVTAACHIARGGTLEIIGKQIKDFRVKRSELKPVLEKDTIRGTVIYIDNYGNAVTNITKEFFNKSRKSRDFVILFGRENEKITRICSNYNEVPIPDKLALFGNNNLLHIAINQGRASNLLGLQFHDIIRIEFK